MQGDGIVPEVTNAAIEVVAAAGVNVALRKALELFANVRPTRNLPGLKTAFEGVDLIVVRENTEDVYAGIEHQKRWQPRGPDKRFGRIVVGID
jgi:isocitrate/isopropylmalate dehydrogenase